MLAPPNTPPPTVLSCSRFCSQFGVNRFSHRWPRKIIPLRTDYVDYTSRMSSSSQRNWLQKSVLPKTLSGTDTLAGKVHPTTS